MTNGSFDLEDKLTFEELAPSLQDMFKIMNVGSLLTNLLDYGTNGRNVKIDSDNTLLFEDDDFRTAKITNTQIQISDIDMQVWQTATAETEANPATQIIPKRIFLYDVSSTNLWYYQDWDNRWCIRKDTSVNTANSKPGDIIKLDRNVNVAFDPNYRFNRVVVDINQLYKEEPLAMICDDGNYYLICYRAEPEYVNHVKVFRVDRIADIAVLDDIISKEAKRASKTIANYPKQVFKMYGGKIRKVRIAFDECLIGVMFNKFGEDISIKKSGKRFTASVEVQISPTFWGWLTQFPNQMEVVSPIDVKAAYSTWVRSAIKQEE